MKSLFDDPTLNEILDRIESLTPQSQRKWGKMDVAQMMAHCKEAFKVPLSDKPYPRSLLGILIGWMVKSKLYNDDAYGKSLPTAPHFLITDKRDFYIEKRELLELVDRFYLAGPEGMTQYPHPFFGKFTPDQWGKSMYKHLDHHLSQFYA